MATLANLVVRISGNTVALNKALGSAERRTGTFSTKAGGSFKLFGTAAKLGIGVAVTALAGLVTSFGLTLKGIVDVEKELRPMIERSRFGAESLQVLSETATRAGSEDGLEGIVDTAQELQLQLGEIALAGKSRAQPALESLGLSAAKSFRLWNRKRLGGWLSNRFNKSRMWQTGPSQPRRFSVAPVRKAGGDHQPDHRRICRP